MTFPLSFRFFYCLLSFYRLGLEEKILDIFLLFLSISLFLFSFLFSFFECGDESREGQERGTKPRPFLPLFLPMSPLKQ